MNFRHFFVPVLILVVAAVTGCASGVVPHESDASDRGSSSASVSASAVPSDDATVAGRSATFPCEVFNFESISTMTRYQIVHARPVPTAGKPTQLSCQYTDDADHSFSIEIDTSEAQADLSAFSQTDKTGASLSGIGDDAWGDENELAAVFGSDYVRVSDDSALNGSSGHSAMSIDRLEAMVLFLHSKI